MKLDQILTSQRLPGLDGVRAISVLAVIASHSGLLPIGGLGVNTFFVLSGFLITWLLLNEWDSCSSISLKGFYLRRVFRIFPAYYFFLAITISADLLLGNSEIKPAIIPSLTYTINYYNVIHGHPSLSVAHMWSLAIEEQFYLLWPALLIFILHRGRSLLIPVLVTIILVSLFWRSIAYIYFDLGSSYVYNAFETRVDSLSIGCLMSVLIRKPIIQSFFDRVSFFSFISLFIFLLAVTLHLLGGPEYRYTLGYTVSSVLAALYLVLLLPQSLSRTSFWRFLEKKWVVYLGVISYPMYLWHSRCLELVEKFGISDVWEKTISGSLVCIIVASCSYYFIEKPFLKMKKKYSCNSSSPIVESREAI